LINCRASHDKDPDSTDGLIKARGLVDSLRQTWETAVEDPVSPVLRILQSKVNTKVFGKLSAIAEFDTIAMSQHYGQCSELLHKAPDSLSLIAPPPETIREKLDALEIGYSKFPSGRRRSSQFDVADFVLEL